MPVARTEHVAHVQMQTRGATHTRRADLAALQPACSIQPLHLPACSAALRKFHQLHQLHRVVAADRPWAGQRVAKGGVALSIVARQVIG